MPEQPRDRFNHEAMEWIDLGDFSPGIFSGWWGSDGQGAPDGALQDDTYGCVASPSGGLVAGPRLVQSYEEPLFQTAGSYPTNEARMVVTGFYNASPVGEADSIIPGNDIWVL